MGNSSGAGRELHCVGVDGGMSYNGRDKVSLHEIKGHLRDRIRVTEQM